MRRLVVLSIALLVASACSTESDGENDRTDVCVLADGRFTCAGRTWPQCPSVASPNVACVLPSTSVTCMGCKEGAAMTCSCQEVDAAMTGVWSCIGAGRACR